MGRIYPEANGYIRCGANIKRRQCPNLYGDGYKKMQEKEDQN
jgi:hypothetical protein